MEYQKSVSTQNTRSSTGSADSADKLSGDRAGTDSKAESKRPMQNDRNMPKDSRKWLGPEGSGSTKIVMAVDPIQKLQKVTRHLRYNSRDLILEVL